MDLNRAMIIGNVTRDPELRTTTTGRSVCSFGVATNRSWNDDAGQKQQQVEFHSVVAWGKLAEICSQFLAKGRRVYIEGRLQTRDWQAQDGQKRQRTEIIAENMIMLDKAGAGAGAGYQPAGAGQDTGAASTPAPTEEVQIEDIPF